MPTLGGAEGCEAGLRLKPAMEAVLCICMAVFWKLVPIEASLGLWEAGRYGTRSLVRVEHGPVPRCPAWSVISVFLDSWSEAERRDLLRVPRKGVLVLEKCRRVPTLLLSFNCVLRKQSPLALKEDDGKLPC